MPELGLLADTLQMDADHMHTSSPTSMVWRKVPTSVLGDSRQVHQRDCTNELQDKVLHVTLLICKSSPHTLSNSSRDARPKSKSHHLQRQTNHAHTGIRHSQSFYLPAPNRDASQHAGLTDIEHSFKEIWVEFRKARRMTRKRYAQPLLNT